MAKFLTYIQDSIRGFAQFPENSALDNKRNRFITGFFFALFVAHLLLLTLDCVNANYQFVPSHIVRIIALSVCIYLLALNKAKSGLYTVIAVFYLTVCYNVFSMPNYSLDALILFPIGTGMFIIARNYTMTFVYFILSCLLFAAGQYFQFTSQKPIFNFGFVFTIFAIFMFFYACLAFYVYEFKFLENEIKGKNSELSQAVEKLTAQNCRLEKNNQLVTQIMAVIAHDLRNPFNNMIGYSTLLHNNYDSYEDEKKKRFVDQILIASEQGHAVLENLLSWARSHSGALIANKKDCDVVELIESVVRELDFQSKQKGIFVFVESPQMFTLKTDTLILSTIVRNLLQNSIKFSPKDMTVMITARQDANSAQIAVRNYGVPIPADQQKMITDKLMAESTAGTLGEKGTGLGLLICQDFATHLGGCISLQSDDEFTEFTVHLPR